MLIKQPNKNKSARVLIPCVYTCMNSVYRYNSVCSLEINPDSIILSRPGRDGRPNETNNVQGIKYGDNVQE